MIKKRRPSEILCRIDVTGFVAILIVLLVLMWTTDTMWTDLHHGVTVNLVHAPHSIAMPRADREDAVIVGVMRDGKVYLGTQQMMSGLELADHLRDRVHSSGEKTVYIKVDARARYRAVSEVVAALQTAGIEKVAFLAWKSSH